MQRNLALSAEDTIAEPIYLLMALLRVSRCLRSYPEVNRTGASDWEELDDVIVGR